MFEWLKNLLFRNYDDESFWDDDEDEGALDRSKMDLSDPHQMDRYIRSCCEQMKEAKDEIDRTSMEYRLITDYLRDIEEIEQLPPIEKKPIVDIAKRIVETNQDKKVYSSRTGSMGDAEYRKVSRYENEMPDALIELKKNEEYKFLVKQDLKNLEGEKISYRFRCRELHEIEESSRQLSIVAIFSVIGAFLLLLFFQIALEFSVGLGYILAVAAGALALTILFVRYGDANRERLVTEKKLNQSIIVQNKIKIRYVNASNLVDYSYTKFGVNSSDELDYLWQKYIAEKRERENLRDADAKLSKEQADLIKVLRGKRIAAPEVWMGQVEALIDPREMVEIRHDLIARRGSLRKRIEYNEENCNAARDEIMDMTKHYPSMAPMILEIVDEFE